MKKEILLGREEVLSWFNRAIKNRISKINLWYEPNRKGLDSLIKEGIIETLNEGQVHIAYIYKNHVLQIQSGSGDCEELLVDLGDRRKKKK